MRIRAEKKVVSGMARASLVGLAVVLLSLTAASAAFARGVATDPNQSYGTVYHPGPDLTNPKLVYAPDPEYPKNKSAWARTSVTCVVGTIVDREGMPREVHVVRSGGKDFDGEAMKVVREYRFAPALHAGKPVAAAINIEVNFRKY